MNKTKIRKSKEGKIFTSPISGRTYKVFRWKDYGDGRIVALEKEEIEKE